MSEMVGSGGADGRKPPSTGFPALSKRVRSATIVGFVVVLPLIVSMAYPQARWILLVFEAALVFMAALETVRMVANHTFVGDRSRTELASGSPVDHQSPSVDSRTQSKPVASLHLRIVTAVVFLAAPTGALLHLMSKWETGSVTDLLLTGSVLVFLSHVLALVAAAYIGRRDIAHFREFFIRLILGVQLVGVGGVGLFILTALPDGARALYWTILLVVATDTGAYFGGNILKGPKLAPALSPGKTVSGSVVGLLFATLIGVSLFPLVAAPAHSTGLEVIGGTRLIVFTAMLSMLAQFGDLLESALKRICNVKDSGGILPGHGGILDRIDSLLFVTPCVVFMECLLLLTH